ncbi:Pentatricopeptide repeat-containing protein [Hordeum vulgare]|nr:Pentatricopeptide repeat-containing protein [Hordeum vulgare]
MESKERDKGNDVVPPLEVTSVQSPSTDDDVPEKPTPLPNGKRRNYDHYHEVGGPTNFCKGHPRSRLATIVVFHQIKIAFTATFKMLTPGTLKVTVFNDDGIEVVNRCRRHDDAFAVNA